MKPDDPISVEDMATMINSLSDLVMLYNNLRGIGLTAEADKIKTVISSLISSLETEPST